MDDSTDILPQFIANTVTNDHDNQHNECSTAQNRDEKSYNKRNFACFWIIAVCNGYGSTVTLSAGFDIIKRLSGTPESPITNQYDSINSRECIQTSTAVLLLANTIPAFLFNLIQPFIPFYVNINMILACLLSMASFAIIAEAQYVWQAIMGISLLSFSAALGDITTLAYLTKFNNSKNLLVAYSSGGGASGVAAALSYAALSDVGFSPTTTLLMMLVVPSVQFVAFLYIKKPTNINLSTSDSVSTTSLITNDRTDESDTTTETKPQPMNFSEKLHYLPKLTKYFVPLLINCLFEYIINQSFDLLYIPHIWLNRADQFRWLQVISQTGAFLGQLSLSFISINEFWPMNLLMGTIMVYFGFEAIYMTVPIIYVIFFFVFFMEFINGCTCISIFFQITSEIPAHYQVFALCSISNGITIGIIIAGILAMPIHEAICKMPAPI